MRSLLLAGLLAVVVAASARGMSDPTPCRDAHYAIVDAPLGDGANADRLSVGTMVGLGDLCPLVPSMRLRAMRSGITAVRAKWKSCPGVDGPVTFRGRIVDGCNRVVGKVRGRRFYRDFEAALTDCGDGILESSSPVAPYTATRASLATHPLPRWFDDAKFGIMIHWGIFAIPAWAELTIDPGEWLCCGKLLEGPEYGRPFFTHIPYVEWYPNTILIDGSPAQLHHFATYGRNFAYEGFRPAFDAASAAWSADAWADLFRTAGARYVVLVTKHHDGYALWPTSVPHPTRTGWHTTRDFVGELDAAVRRRCMRMGLYYSGGFDWSVQPGPVVTAFDAARVAPTTPEYLAYADGQWRELIERYEPAVLWNDINYPNEAAALRLFADYYNRQPDGVVNDRFSILPGLTHHDYSTPEFTVLADVSPTKFETVRGMGRGFGYNRNESDATLDSAEELIHLLIDVVSKNGNLLLNVGPMADGTVPAAQVERLRAIGAWLAVNGEAIYDSRPWTHAESSATGGARVRFTTSADGKTLYAIVLGPLPEGTFTISGVGASPTAVRLLGSNVAIPFTAAAGDLTVTVPADVASEAASVFALAQP